MIVCGWVPISSWFSSLVPQLYNIYYVSNPSSSSTLYRFVFDMYYNTYIKYYSVSTSQIIVIWGSLFSIGFVKDEDIHLGPTMISGTTTQNTAGVEEQKLWIQVESWKEVKIHNKMHTIPGLTGIATRNTSCFPYQTYRFTRLPPLLRIAKRFCNSNYNNWWIRPRGPKGACLK